MSSRPSSLMFRSWREVRVHAKAALPLAKQFECCKQSKSPDRKNIVPIILSHGLTGSRSVYTTLCAELASFGYMVFAIDHHDGSGSYSEKKDGTPVRFDSKCPRDKFDMNGAGQKHTAAWAETRR